MATKRFNEKKDYYEIVVENKNYIVRVYDYTTYCYSSGNHVEHSCVEIYGSQTYETVADVMGRDSWCGRDWQRFTYDNSRQDAVAKLPKFLRLKMKEILVDEEYKKIHEESEAFLKTFQDGLNALTKENKEKIAETVGTIETEAQSDAALKVIQLASLMQ